MFDPNVTTADIREVLLDTFPTLGMHEHGDLDAAIEGQRFSVPRPGGGAKLDVQSLLHFVQQWAGPTWAVISIANFLYGKWKASPETPAPMPDTVLRDYEVEHGEIVQDQREQMHYLATAALQQASAKG
jgi:hypothetical protein